MHKGTHKNLLHAKTTHRIPKIVTLGISSCLLVAIVSVDASASGHTGKDEYAVRTDAVLNLTSTSFRYGAKRWAEITAPITDPTTSVPTTPTVSAGGATAVSSGDTSGGGGGTPPSTTTTTAAPTTTTTAPATTTTPTTTTTTTTAPPPATPVGARGLITAGASRSECVVEPDASNTLSGLQDSINNFQSATDSTVSCVGVYTDSASTWSQWSDPWITTSAGSAYQSWVAEAPQSHQLVVEVDLIPSNLSDVNDPLSWETSCAAGDFNSYASQLGANLVSAGLQNSVIRLASEANGTWEGDYVGSTTQEQTLWASCFDNEVTALRSAAGEHFLIDWNPDACTQPIPWANYYPGNSYVDIMGLDLYDVDCHTPDTAVSYSTLSNEAFGLVSFEAFAASQGKPMSFPEWGLASSSAGDDPAYISGIASTVNNGNFAFQEYFDTGSGGSLPIDAGSTPLSAAAYGRSFGN
jgi:hypothetical protein